MNEDLGSPWAGPVNAAKDEFLIGLVHSLTINELFSKFDRHPAAIDTVQVALARVLRRFPDAELSAEVHDTILNRVMHEVTNVP